MRVLMFGWEFPPFNSGGLGVACLGLTQALARKNIEITFVLPRTVKIDFAGQRVLFADTFSNLTLQSINSPLSPYITSREYARAATAPEAEFSLYGHTLLAEVYRYARQAAEIARREKFDVIHAHDWLSFPAGLIAKQVSGKPLIVHVHATEFDRTGGHGVNQAVYGIEQAGMAAADMVIAVSNFTKNIILAHYNVPTHKITVVHNGIDTSVYEACPREHIPLAYFKTAGWKIVLFVGRITLQKGPDYFLQAARHVLEHYPKAVFVIAGDGDMQSSVIGQAADLGISDKVFFTGFMRGMDLECLYQAADLLVMPSVSEPFGITPLESILNGTPVLISKQSGVAEVLSHALKADFWDIEEMANKILAVLYHAPLYESLRANSRREIARVSWDESARRCIDIYQQTTKVV